MKKVILIRLLLSAGFFIFGSGNVHANATHAKANAETLRELYQVVLLKVPQDRAAFGNWVDSLNQGASIEGVYNGFSHSKEYRELEKLGTTQAKPEAVQVFVDQWFHFQQELIKKAELHASDALPLQEVDFSGLGNPVSTPVKSPILLQESTAKRAFAKASVFTLKRVLGDQALIWVHEGRHEGADPAIVKKTFPLRYARWVLDGLRSHVDFGLSLRNRDDATFHAQWADRELKSKRGILEWEVLNRIHRLINSAQAEVKTEIKPKIIKDPRHE